MTTGANAAHATSLRDYLQIVRRQAWIILLGVVVVPLAAVLYSQHEAPRYQATSQVLLSGQDLQNALTGVQAPTSNSPDPTLVATQAQLARVPDIAARAIGQLGLRMTPNEFLAACSVSSSTTTDILGFSCEARHSASAERMVNAYARQYTIYRRRLDTNALASASRAVAKKIAQLERRHHDRGALYDTLLSREQELQTMEQLQTSNATVVKVATDAAQVAPRTKRNGILGLVLGIAIGLGLAFLREALDTRVRSTQEIGERLGAPLLGRLPAPDRALRSKNRLVMLADPGRAQAEAYRMLRTSIDLATLGRATRTIMITSAVEQEGKSTTIANLGVALARAGQRVVLLDLDLRRPFLANLFDLHGPGITEVALGRVPLEQALNHGTVALTGRNVRETRGPLNGHVRSSGNGAAKGVKGVLAVLPSGPIPPDPGEFVGTHALGELLGELRELADTVLIDAPPALHVGDALTLSTKVDGIIVVTRIKTVRRHMLTELARQLASSPTPVLGFVATGAEAGEGYEGTYAHYSSPYVQRHSTSGVKEPLG